MEREEDGGGKKTREGKRRERESEGQKLKVRENGGKRKEEV